MSDDLSIPSPAYRLPQQRGGLDPALRRLMMYAGGLVAVGVVIGGVSLLFGRQGNGPVPVISADPRPLRVKPENPGGMQIAGWRADRPDGDQPGKLAPGPEAPEPGLLQAAPSTPPAEAPDTGAPRATPATRSQAADAAGARTAASPSQAASQGSGSAVNPPLAKTSQPRTPPAPTPVPTVTTVAPRTATSLAPPAGARPVPAPTPVAPAVQAAAAGQAAPSAARSAPPVQQVAMGTLVAPAGASATAVARPVSVQLAALLTEDAARAEWQQMERRMPEVLGSHTPSFSRFERDGRAYWRVRVLGFGDVQQAKTFCERVRNKNASCSVADF